MRIVQGVVHATRAEAGVFEAHHARLRPKRNCYIHSRTGCKNPARGRTVKRENCSDVRTVIADPNQFRRRHFGPCLSVLFGGVKVSATAVAEMSGTAINWPS